MPLTIVTREVNHVTILDIHGRLVLGPEIGALRDEVRSLIAQGKKKIILNLADVDYLDSSGVGELVGSFTTVRNAGGNSSSSTSPKKFTTSSTSPSSIPSSTSKTTNS